MDTGHRIIVGIDGSPASTAALQWAVEEARRNGRPVLAVSVSPLQAKPSSSTPMPITRPAGNNPFREQHLRDLRNAVEQVGTAADGVAIDQLVPTGHPGHVLVELCGDADTLVLGGHGYRKGGVTVVGSTISYCLRHATCAVTVIPFTSERHDSLADAGAAQQFR